MTDEDILNFMDACGVQCWPEWTPDHTIRNWVAQTREPFHQVSRKTLRAAVVDLYHSIERLRKEADATNTSETKQ